MPSNILIVLTQKQGLPSVAERECASRINRKHRQEAAFYAKQQFITNKIAFMLAYCSHGIDVGFDLERYRVHWEEGDRLKIIAAIPPISKIAIVQASG